MLEQIGITVGPPLTGLAHIDVEALLVWTYRNQRADVVVDHGLGLHRTEASLDGVEFHGASACGCAAVGRIHELGARVDGTGGCAALHEDAEVVHGAVTRLEPWEVSMVVRHARAGDRPDTMAGVRPRAVWDVNRRGQVTVRYEPWDKGRRYGWCPVRWTVSIAAMEAARLEYTLWRCALDRVAATLRIEGRLTRHAVTGPSAPLQPWIEENACGAHKSLT